MKKIIDAIRDFLYNITDYGLIITVIVVMAAVLSWRFNILFNRGIDKEVIAELPESTENAENGNKGGNDPENADPSTEDPGNTDETPAEEPSGDESESGLIATVTIPEGTLPSKIGDILLNSNLIQDKNKFLSRAVELGLDTKLRSGTYEIKVGTSLDNVIKTIANAN